MSFLKNKRGTYKRAEWVQLAATLAPVVMGAISDTGNDKQEASTPTETSTMPAISSVPETDTFTLSKTVNRDLETAKKVCTLNQIPADKAASVLQEARKIAGDDPITDEIWAQAAKSVKGGEQQPAQTQNDGDEQKKESGIGGIVKGILGGL